MADAAEQAPKDLIGFLDFYLVKKAPFQIPDAGREFIVKFGPWITLVVMIIALPVVLFLLGLGTLLSPFGGVTYMATWGLASVLLLLRFALRAASLPGLFARKMYGWNLWFYSVLVGLVESLLSVYGIVSGILVTIIVLYILFQVRSKYA
jgi:hypothetical protein